MQEQQMVLTSNEALKLMLTETIEGIINKAVKIKKPTGSQCKYRDWQIAHKKGDG
ncbi:MAG: hypothetical protein JNM21_07065 [Taibaiella sp.]|nr:hypothetical protein [Taibaiella sp.]